MWQDGTIHPTHDMSNEISTLADVSNGDTLYAEQVNIEYGGSNARHGANIGVASEEEGGLALAPGRAAVNVRSGNQDPEQVGYDDSLAWGGFGADPATDVTTSESQAPAAAKAELTKIFLWGSVAAGALWLWGRR